MVFDYFLEDIMNDIRLEGILSYTINNIGFVKVLRNTNHKVPFKDGKKKHTLILIKHGEMNYYFINTGKSVTLAKGEALFIPRNYPYVATYTQDNTVAKIFNFDIISEDMPKLFRAPLHKKSPKFSGICESVSGNKVNNITFLASKIYELLYVLEKESDQTPNKFRKIIPALNELQQNYFENKKVSYYSDMCYMSESNFRTLFKEYTGSSPIEYRNLIRISKVKEMIESGEYKVAEAAYLVGFNNMSFFYDVFNKYLKK